jgi:hypothetical protein
VDRISALRNVEEALRAFETGEQSLDATQRAVRSVLQTYATEFETDERRPYRASGDAAVDGVVVVATSESDASDRVRSLTGAAEATFDVAPL